jgi:hypothetical protein
MKRLMDLIPCFAPDEGGGGGGEGYVQTDAALLESLDSMSDEQQVPVSVVKAIRKELQEIKSNASQKDELIKTKDDQIFLLRTTLNQNAPAQTGGNAGENGKAKTGTFLDEMEDDEPLTAGQGKQLVAMNAAAAKDNAALAKAQADPDFQVLITTHIQNVLKADPDLVTDLASLPPAKRYLYAYKLAKSDPEYHKSKMKTPIPKLDESADSKAISDKAKKIEANLAKPGSPSSVPATVVTSSEADRISKMNAKEFRQYRYEKQQAGIAARKG